MDIDFAHLEITMLHMAKKKKKTGSRHLDRHMVSLNGDIYEAMRLIAQQNQRPINWQIRLFLIEAAKAAKVWPIPEDPGQ